MKFFGILLLIIQFAISPMANAQELNQDSILGTWQYKSPKGKNKLTYRFDLEKKFLSTMERKENETITEGTYEFDKINGLDRLILTVDDKNNSMRSLVTYHLIKPIGTDTLKLQSVNDKQTNWTKETKRNTMIFVRKKEKTKE